MTLKRELRNIEQKEGCLLDEFLEFSLVLSLFMELRRKFGQEESGWRLA